MTSARTPELWGHMCSSKEPGTATSEQHRRRYAERGVDRQHLRLRIDRELASRLRAAALARRVSMNALAEGLLADHLVGADAYPADLDLSQLPCRVRPPAPPVDPPTSATHP
ncbi:MAG: hypothetical protein JWO98_1986 [Frankiales bacterium]|nr:hypothetical protein [Frankiales bacterium]